MELFPSKRVDCEVYLPRSADLEGRVFGLHGLGVPQEQPEDVRGGVLLRGGAGGRRWRPALPPFFALGLNGLLRELFV